MSQPRILLVGLSALVALSFLSCVEQDQGEDYLDPMATSPATDIDKLLPNGIPYTITYPSRAHLDNDNIIDMPDGIHLRPGVKIHEMPADQVEYIYQDGDDLRLFHVSGPARETLRTADRHDVVFVDDGVAFIVDEVRREVDETVFVTRPFNLIDVIYGNFRLTFQLPMDQMIDTETGEPLDRTVTQEPAIPGVGEELETRKQALETFFTFEDAYEKKGVSNGFELEFKTELKFKAQGGAEGVFEGQISYINEAYDCKNPDEVSWFEGSTFCVDRLVAYFTLGADISIDADLTATGKIEYEVSSYNNGREKWSYGPKGIPLGTTGLALSLEPYIRATFKAGASASITGGFKWASRPQLPIGFEYVNNSEFQRNYSKDGVYPIPNRRYPFRGNNSGIQWKGFSGQAKYFGEFELRAGIKFGAQNVGTRVISLTGADIYAKSKIEANFRLLQSPGSTDPCLEAKLETKVAAEPSILFTIDAKVKSWSFNIFCDPGGDACARIETGNLTPNVKWEGSSGVCTVGAFSQVNLSLASSTPAGRDDINGYEVDGIALIEARSGGTVGSVSSRTSYATGGPSASRGRPDATCSNLSSKVTGITGSSNFTFNRALKSGDTIQIVQVKDASGGCRGSGTIRVTLQGGGLNPQVLGTISQNGSLTVP